MRSVISQWCMIVACAVVFGIPIPASAVWFQIDIYGTNTYKSNAAIPVTGLSDGYNGRCIFGPKNALGVVVEEGGTNFTSWSTLHYNIYSWGCTVSPTSAWTVSPLVAGASAPDHYFTVVRLGTQYGTRGPQIVIP